MGLRFWLWLGLTFCFLAPLSVAQIDTRPDDVRVEIDLPLGELPMQTGFSAVVFELSNPTDRERFISLLVRNWSAQSQSEQSVRLGAREEARIELPIPISVANANLHFSVYEGERQIANESGQQRRFTGRRYYSAARSVIQEFAVLAVSNSEGLTRDFKARLTPPNRRTDDYEIQIRGVQPLQLPAKWQSLMGVDFIVVDTSSWQQLDSNQQTALERYVSMGGILLLHDISGSARSEIRRRFPNGTASQDATIWHLGAGFLATWKGDFLESSDEEPWRRLFRSLENAGVTAPSARSRFGKFGKAPFLAPIPGFGTVDASRFAMVILLFAIVVGPINFFVLNRKNRRTWALWTIPCISGIAFLGLVGYSLVSEGIDTKVIPRSMTFLDQETQVASSFDRLAYYANLAPGRLRFDANVAIAEAKRPFDPYRYRRVRRADLSIDWSDGLTLNEGWLPVRTPTQIFASHQEPFRQRVDFRVEADGKVSIYNGFDNDIEAILYRDTQNKTWLAENVKAGQTGLASVVKTKPTTFVYARISEALLTTWPRSRLSRVNTLRPGSYLAITDGSINPCYGGEGFTIMKGVALVYGRCGKTNK